jgi:site-specific recombinase XerD
MPLHGLRHSSASIAIEAGVDLKTISNALGRSAISTTADIYAHVTDSLMRDAADRINNAVMSAAVAAGKGP